MKSGQENWVESVKNAASGYGAVVLGIVCFLVVLVVIMAIMRFVVGLGPGTGTGV